MKTLLFSYVWIKNTSITKKVFFICPYGFWVTYGRITIYTYTLIIPATRYLVVIIQEIIDFYNVPNITLFLHQYSELINAIR